MTVTARKIAVGRDIPESISAERAELYRWLGEQLAGSSGSEPTAEETVYVTPEELSSPAPDPRSYLRRYLPAGDGPQLLIVDLAENPYHLLGEPLLFNVARLTCGWHKAAADRSLVVMLPRLPPASSGFWLELRSLDGTAHGTARLIVLANDGQCEAVRGDTPDAAFTTGYRDRQARSEPEESPLSAKVVRKLGHYGVSGHGAPRCRRYFFDVENAVPEIGRLADDWLTRVIEPRVPDPARLFLVSRDRQMGLHEAIAGIAAARGCRFGRLDPEGRIHDATGMHPLDPDDVDETVVPFFSVVDRTSTYENVIRALRAQGVTLAPRAWAVMITSSRSGLTLAKSPVPLRGAMVCDRQTRLREECEQCAIGLPHTDPLREGHALRSYDVWDVFLASAWGSERITPLPSGHRFHYAPDLKAVFDEHGGWVARKVMALLDALGFPSGVVIVCPDEAPIRSVVDRLATLMDDRPTVIRIPSEVLDHRTTLDAEERAKHLRETQSHLWRRQLRHLSDRGGKVVILDEFRASGTTARTMRGILKLHGIEPRALVPIIDFSEAGDLDGLPVHPLYRIRAARSGR